MGTESGPEDPALSREPAAPQPMRRGKRSEPDASRPPARAPGSLALQTALIRQGPQFGFFQAIRFIQFAALRAARASEAEARPIGYDYEPGREAVRCRASTSLSFPAGEIRRVRQVEAGAEARRPTPPLEMEVHCLGLVGPSGALPRHYTAMLIERTRMKDFALRDFLDLFHHRTLSLFYRAWEKYRFPVGYEQRPLREAGEKPDLFTWGLYCFLGFGTDGLRGRMAFDDQALLYYAGQFARRPPSAVSLEQIIADRFGLAVRVEQFQGQWLYLDHDDQSSLPGPRDGRARNNSLGSSVILGERVWDVEGRFRLRVGPVDYAQFCRFFPAGDVLLPLCQLTRTYVGPQYDFDVQPVLRGEDVPRCVLGGAGDGHGSRLGWNSWIQSRPPDSDVDDAVFTLEGSPWSPST